MKIGLLCPEPLGAGGIGTYTMTHALALAELGHEVWVGVRDRAPTQLSHPLIQVEAIAPPDPYRIPAFNGYWGLTLGLLPWAASVAQAVLKHPCDCYEVPEWLAGALLLGTSRPLLIRLHSHLALVRRLNQLPPSLDAKLSCRLERAAMTHARSILANSRALADELAKDYRIPRDRIEVLPLGIDLRRFQVSSGLNTSLGLSEEAVLALFVGRLERRKGIEDLFEAFFHAAPHHERLHLAIAGHDTDTGPFGISMQAHLAAMVSEAGLGERVHWLGNRASEHVPALYAGCDFLIAPSPFESFGLVYLEALASGRPVIACNTGGVPDLVQDGVEGLLIPAHAPERLAQSLMTLAGDADLRSRMGMAARQKASRFDSRQIAAQAVHHYERLLERPALLARRTP